MLKEPIYKSTVSLNFADTYNLAKKLSGPYKVKSASKSSGKIVLSASYLFKFGLYFAWIKEIVIQVIRVAPDKTSIEVYGKPAILPHNIFLTYCYIKRKIDVDSFSSSIAIGFKPFLVKENTLKDDPKYPLKNIMFFVLEMLAVVSSTALLLYSLYVNDGTLLPAFVLAFIIPQLALIIWLTRDCYGRSSLSQSKKMKWVTLIGSTGFIGALLYNLKIIRKEGWS